jgi:hypothetical protein
VSQALACYQRKPFATEAAAMTVVYRLRAQGRAQVEAEQCEHCKKWHLRVRKLIPDIR